MVALVLTWQGADYVPGVSIDALFFGGAPGIQKKRPDSGLASARVDDTALKAGFDMGAGTRSTSSCAAQQELLSAAATANAEVIGGAQSNLR